jgi:hypothetical protein
MGALFDTSIIGLNATAEIIKNSSRVHYYVDSHGSILDHTCMIFMVFIECMQQAC